MKRLIAALALMATPAFSGDKIENLSYSLPPGRELNVRVACATEMKIHLTLDYWEQAVAMLSTTGRLIDGCGFFPDSITIPTDVLVIDHLYLSDGGELFAIFDFALPDDGHFWFFLGAVHLEKEKEGDPA